jgi:cytochrome P450
MRKNNNEVESILRGLIGKRMHAMEEGKSSEDDLLGLLLESNRRDMDENGRPSQGMTMEDVIEECKLFYLVGMETTSVLLTWTMIVLSMHPEWQDLAREEVLGLFERNKPNYEGLSRLKIVSTTFGFASAGCLILEGFNHRNCQWRYKCLLFSPLIAGDHDP